MTKQTNNTTKTVKLPITRHRIKNKRRMMLALEDLAKMTNQNPNELTKLMQSLPLRKSVDYVYDTPRNGYLLALHSAQTLLALNGTPNAWQTYHQITDLIQGGFNKD